MNLSKYFINKKLDDIFYKSEFFKDLCLLSSSSLDMSSILDSFTDINGYNNIINAYNKYPQPKITCGIITFNEERCIKRCIDSIQAEVDEILILDFHSNDNTIKIASDYDNISIHSAVWQKDFSLARNKVIELCKNSWIIFLDADEYLLEHDKCKIRNSIKMLDFLNIKNLAACPIILDNNGTKYCTNRRILNKKFDYKFFGRIHEELLLDGHLVPKNVTCNITLLHDGYEKDIFKSKGTHERNIELEKLMIKENPDDVKGYFFLAKSYIITNDFPKMQEAYKLFKHVIESDNIEKTNYIYISSLVYICKLCLDNQNYTELSKYTEKLKILAPSCADIGYFELSTHLAYSQYKLSNIVDIINKTYMSSDNESYLNHTKNHLKLISNITLFFSGQTELAINRSIFNKDQNFQYFLIELQKQINIGIQKFNSDNGG